MSETGTKRRRKLWIIEWAREEAFWKDVAKNALSGLIVAGVLTLLASGLGLIDPSGWRVIGSMSVVLATLGLSLMIFVLFLNLLPEQEKLDNGKYKQPQSFLFTGGVLLAIPASFLIAGTVISLFAIWMGLPPLIDWRNF